MRTRDFGYYAVAERRAGQPWRPIGRDPRKAAIAEKLDKGEVPSRIRIVVDRAAAREIAYDLPPGCRREFNRWLAYICPHRKVRPSRYYVELVQ